MPELDAPHVAPSVAPSVRRATSADVEAILQLMDELADYESLERPTVEAKKRLAADIGMYRTKMPELDAPRRATSADTEAILQLVDALADYESLTRPTAEAKKRLAADMGKRFDAWIAQVDGKAAGYAFVFETYSSFLALPTLYLEDLFVLPEYRSRKVGLALFTEMLEEAKRRGCGRMEWTVLDWNELAINFYKRAGAEHMKAWHHYRIVL